MQSLFIQIIGFAGTAFFFLSFQFKENKKLFRVQLLAYSLYTLHLFLLGAFSGACSYVLNAFRSYALGSKHAFLKSKKMCLLICLLQVLILFFTWAGWVSILPIAANIASTIGSYSRNGKKLRLANMFINSPLWMIYALLVHSYAGILDEVVSEISMILSVIRYGWKALDQTDDA